MSKSPALRSLSGVGYSDQHLPHYTGTGTGSALRHGAPPLLLPGALGRPGPGRLAPGHAVAQGESPEGDAEVRAVEGVDERIDGRVDPPCKTTKQLRHTLSQSPNDTQPASSARGQRPPPEPQGARRRAARGATRSKPTTPHREQDGWRGDGQGRGEGGGRG